MDRSLVLIVLFVLSRAALFVYGFMYVPFRHPSVMMMCVRHARCG